MPYLSSFVQSVSSLWLTNLFLKIYSCPNGDGFIAIGWYRIPPGQCLTVYNGNVNYNRYWAYYAEATDGATWSGNIQSWVSNSAFSLCHGSACTPCRVVGFRLLDVNNFTNYTLTLTA